MIRHFLRCPTTPICVLPDKKISELSKEMLHIGFQGRKLAEVVEVWCSMLRRRNAVIWLGLAGAMVPAGMRKIVSYLIRRRMIDVLVSTGANMYHDFFEALGYKHYVGTHTIDDIKLRKMKIDRIYDVFADEKRFYKVDIVIEKNVTTMLADNYPYSSRQVLRILGQYLSKAARDKDSILATAYNADVPIFAPAICDSSIGFSIMFANRRRSRKIILDQLKDVEESSRITEKAKWSGVIYIGGGVPKNFIQQTAVIASYQTRHDRSHSAAIQITTDSPQWGGLSGCTFEEGQSWGKIGFRAKTAVCYCDATIALPFVSHALSERFLKLTRYIPVFNWQERNLTIEYKRMRL
ncbi:MAG: deoxyhypusine synthase [Thermoproteota archaeon]